KGSSSLFNMYEYNIKEDPASKISLVTVKARKEPSKLEVYN
ncbi:2972_t:CDS:2, partial [Diversispora eburnea]